MKFFFQSYIGSVFGRNRCGIRYTVKVAKDTDREEKKKNCSITKNTRANNLTFDSRQLNTEVEAVVHI